MVKRVRECPGCNVLLDRLVEVLGHSDMLHDELQDAYKERDGLRRRLEDKHYTVPPREAGRALVKAIRELCVRDPKDPDGDGGP